MGAKPVVATLTSGIVNPSTLNSNFDILAEAVADCLDRSGDSDTNNIMLGDLDMGGFTIKNMGEDGTLAESALESALRAEAAAAIAVSNTGIGSVDTINDLRNLIGAYDGQLVQVAGYYAVGDGGGGPLRRWDATSTAADDGGAVINPTVSGAGRWLFTVTGELNIRDYGAKGDGVTDDWDAFNGALLLLESVGGSLLIPPGRYGVSDGFVIHHGINIIGVGQDELSTDPDGTGLTSKVYLFALNTITTMFTYVSNVTPGYLFGGGISGLEIDGKNITSVAIHASSTNDQVFRNLKIRNVKVDGIKLSSDNLSLSVSNIVDNFRFEWGGDVACAAANALVLDGDGAGLAQTRVSIFGLVKDGDLVWIRNADNNLFERVHGVVDTGGVGYAVQFVAGAGFAVQADNNVFEYVVGPILAKSGTNGNLIKHFNSEMGGITAEAGATIHYTAIDAIHEDVFRTHSYVMSDELFIPAASFGITGGSVTSGVGSALWNCFSFPDSADGVVGFSGIAPYAWGNGTITGLRIALQSEGVNSSKAVSLQIKLSVGNGFTTPTPEKDQYFEVPVGAQYVAETTFLELTTPLAYTRGDMILLTVARHPGDAADTAAGALSLFGASLVYQGTGPNSANAGTYSVTSPYVI